MDKLKLLYEVSNPETVAHKAALLHLNPIHPSSQARFKFMVFNGEKMVHFGDIHYQDFTKHKNLRRLNNFRTRNRRFATAPVYSPAWLSYYLLW